MYTICVLNIFVVVLAEKLIEHCWAIIYLLYQLIHKSRTCPEIPRGLYMCGLVNLGAQKPTPISKSDRFFIPHVEKCYFFFGRKGML